jgi:hypothetical protein
LTNIGKEFLKIWFIILLSIYFTKKSYVRNS